MSQKFYAGLFGDHSFSTYAKVSEKLKFRTTWSAHVRLHQGERKVSFLKNLAKILNEWFFEAYNIFECNGKVMCKKYGSTFYLYFETWSIEIKYNVTKYRKWYFEEIQESNNKDRNVARFANIFFFLLFYICFVCLLSDSFPFLVWQILEKH